MKTLLYPLVFCCVLGCGAAKALSSVPVQDCPLQVRWVPEMGPIPELEWAQGVQTTAATDALKQATRQWKRLSQRLKSQLTPAMVRQLSRWAKAEMERYTVVPPFKNTELSLVGQEESRHRFLFEGTIDTLPSHSGIVLRWLKVYLVYDQEKQCITDTLLSIRGVRIE